MTETLATQGQTPSPIQCETAVRRMWDHVDRRLPIMARDEVEAHLKKCILCAPRFAFARAMKEALGELRAREMAGRLGGEERTALTERIQGALRRAHDPGSTPR